MSHRTLLFVAFAGVTCLAASSDNAAKAEELLFSNYSPQGASGIALNNDRTIGTRFTVGANQLSVRELGVYDHDGLGLSVGHMVGIWDTGGTLLGSTNIGPGSHTLKGNWQFVTLDLNDQFVLSANTTYVIGAHTNGTLDEVPFETIGGGSTFNSASTVTVPDFDGGGPFDGNSVASVNGTGFAFPPTASASTRLFANAVVVAVPEPSSVLFLGGLAMVGGVFYRRRRKLQNAA